MTFTSSTCIATGQTNLHMNINQSITGFAYGALNSKSFATMIQRCPVAMVNQRHVERHEGLKRATVVYEAQITKQDIIFYSVQHAHMKHE